MSISNTIKDVCMKEDFLLREISFNFVSFFRRDSDYFKDGANKEHENFVEGKITAESPAASWEVRLHTREHGLLLMFGRCCGRIILKLSLSRVVPVQS